MASVFIDQNVECVVKITELKELKRKAAEYDAAQEAAEAQLAALTDMAPADTGAEDLPVQPPDMSESNTAEVDRAEGHLAGEDT